MARKIICIFLSLIMLCCNISANGWYYYESESGKVTFIVETDGDPLSYAEKTTFSATGLQTRKTVMSAITEEISPDSEIGYVYTKLFNGFSVEADLNKLEEIRAIPGVKNVYIASRKHLPEPMMTSAGDLTGTSFSYNLGYDGEGTVIAILDAGCDTNHQFFATSPENPKYLNSDINTIVTNTTLHSCVSSANQVYRNAKIPYAYNYAEGNTDVYYSNISHGTHVAGIAAGKNGTSADGNIFSGVAPEAQLLIMTCATSEGEFPEEAILAAIEDAYTLGADVINMSFGSDYADSTGDSALNQMIQNAKAAGVAIITAAGNASRGFENKTPYAINPDYSASGTPSGFSAATSVASADNTTYSSSGKVSYFSSWGVDSILELKPEITAPGRGIYSSVPGGGYSYSSGTSMASPHMAGVYAIAAEYYMTNPFAANYNNLTGTDKVNLIENLAMNSADVILQSNGVPYSPRVQGAGLVNIEKLINSRVILKGNSGKAKISLGDNLDSKITLEFDITNISNESITFDKITLDVLTDGHTSAGKVSSSISVPVTVAEMPSAITVASGETYTFKASIALDEGFISETAAVFTNGFFIDGFVTLEGENSLCSSLPFTGFYGDFSAAPIFDTTIYDNGGSSLISAEETGVGGTFIAMTNGSSYMPLGMNSFDMDMVDGKYVAYSPDSGYGLRFFGRNLRSLSSITFTILNKNGTTEMSATSNVLLNKFTKYYYTFSASRFSSLAEGNYTFKVGGRLVGKSAITDTLEIPFVIDNTAPEIIDASYDSTNKTVTVTATDNHFVSGITVGYTNSAGNTRIVKEAVDNETDLLDGVVTKTIDVSDAANPQDIQLLCMDYASNSVTAPLDLYTDTIGAELVSLTRLETVTVADIIVRNNSESLLNAKLIAAFFDDRNTLVGISSCVRELSPAAPDDVNYTFLTDTRGASKMQLFIW
ncbi:MAG: S8 family serine peptidase, partial [Clostridia bacterium]|nr:S8 family serine peptidase [Clostridia bacterium]